MTEYTVIPAPAPDPDPGPALDPDPGFAGMTVHTNNRKLRSIEDSLNLALMPYQGAGLSHQTFFPKDVNVTVGDKLIPDDLVGLVPLSGNENDVFGPG